MSKVSWAVIATTVIIVVCCIMIISKKEAAREFERINEVMPDAAEETQWVWPEQIETSTSDANNNMTNSSEASEHKSSSSPYSTDVYDDGPAPEGYDDWEDYYYDDEEELREYYENY